MNQKNISVIVPVYNTEKYLSKCLDSLVNQTLEDIEIIVVNDGSPDNSDKVIEKYIEEFPQNFVYINQKNGGLSNARNNGLKVATGEYVFFLDSDDYLREDTFELLFQEAKDKESDIVLCDTMWVYEGTNKEILQVKYKSCGDTMQKNYITSVPHACGKLLKRTLLDKMSFSFREGIIYEDLAVMPSLAICAKNISYVEEPLYFYLQRAGSIMNTRKYNEKFKDIYISLENLFGIFEKYNAREEYSEELEFLCIEHLLRSACLRFSYYKEGQAHVNKIISVMHEKYPRYMKNKYFKNWSIKSKLICFCMYNRMINTAKLINKIKR